MESSTLVMGYRLLKSTDMLEDKHQLARVTIFTFFHKYIKKQLKTCNAKIIIITYFFVFMYLMI